MRTLGKWEVVDMPDDEICGILPVYTWDDVFRGGSDKNGGLDLAHCYGADRYSNVALCAAAPELATAIDLILRTGLTKETRKKAREALKKARKAHEPG